VIDAQGTGFAQCPPTRDQDAVNPIATVVAIAERAATRYWRPDDTASEMTMDDSDVAAQSSSPRENETDAELAGSFERGALPLLASLYRGGALALTGDRSEAQDLPQETMTNAYISICRAGHRQLRECPTDTTTGRPPPGVHEGACRRTRRLHPRLHDDRLRSRGEVMAAVQMTILAGPALYTAARCHSDASDDGRRSWRAVLECAQPNHGPTTPRLKVAL
jgi:hypothetical protein